MSRYQASSLASGPCPWSGIEACSGIRNSSLKNNFCLQDVLTAPSEMSVAGSVLVDYFRLVAI